ncbi:MAG: ribosome recycling factor [Candidatus Kerfeldbacteria bacterium CG08_land_8_20_14_0_20_40_16]|uniref:Ribosome-recycling factor n=1 Tax=Candidatus Kerfeldbacteria bacterium CG08_land_8_20_14_0_20_40_16 TaxID=2014244 RepID=A0A2H0YUD9_9BACT|nr:MAG: ribosome recycling factor [Candidatus Kerfeldbacteria bacterium CG08_land_8_20_14_0_20_40_16]
MINLEDFKLKSEKALEHLKSNLSQIRTGRATPTLVENIKVLCYGTESPLVQLATITAPDSTCLLIQPWDKSILKDVEKAIQKSDLGIQPVNEGQQIRIKIPPLTEEKRKELIKIVNERVEETKIAIRNIRENVLKEMKNQEKEGSISEDEFFAFQKDIQKQVDAVMDKIAETFEKKEKEILTV